MKKLTKLVNDSTFELSWTRVRLPPDPLLFIKRTMPYSDKVIDHYENPQNVGSLDKNDPYVGTGLVGAKFKTFGCGSAIASSSLITTLIKGRTIVEAENIKNSDIAKELSLPPVKIHCSVLAEDAIKAAIKDYKNKHDEK